MTRECIEDIREVVLPFVRNTLLKTNYENLGKSDAEEFTRDFNEILDLAIKALEQEPVIRHNEVKDELNRVKDELESTTKNDLGVDCIVDVLGSYTDLDIPYKREIAENILTKLSSVTPQPRKGHWIECMPGGAEEWCYKCSECNFWKYKKTINLSKFNFCPNCGAKMAETEET